MASANYRLIRSAMFAEQRIACVYDDHPREICPVVLGRTEGEEKLLGFQVGGASSKPLPRDGQWKCLFIAKMRDVRLNHGPWREGSRHGQEQRCVQEVDVDINIHVRRRR